MDAMPQIPLGQSNLFLNPDPRCACTLLLDTSGSMDGVKIDQLNQGFQALLADLSRDMIALRRVELAVLTFGGSVTIAQPFTTVDRVSLPAFTAGGGTPMGEAVQTGLKLLEDRKKDYQQAGVSYFRGWTVLISDGAATDDIKAACRAVKAAEQKKSLSFFAVGVDGADMTELAKLSARPPLHLNGLAFTQMFLWLSASLRAVSRSSPGAAVPLTNPTGSSGWGTVSS